MAPWIYTYIKQSIKHPTFSFVPWKLSVPAIVPMQMQMEMEKAVRTVSSLCFVFEDGTLTDDGKVLRANSVKREVNSVQREAP